MAEPAVEPTETTQTEPVVDSAAAAKPVIDSKADEIKPGEETSKPEETKPEEKSLLAEASDAEKRKTLDEETRLLEAKDEDLTPEDLAKKREVVKTREEAAKNLTDEEKAALVPEKYEFKTDKEFTMSEALEGKVSEFFKGEKLNQESADKFVSFYTEIRKDEVAQQEADFKTFVDNSRAETKKALGNNWQEEMAVAAKVKERCFSDETVQFLDDSGLGNNVHVIQDLIGLGKMISEDVMIGGKPVPGGEKTAAETMYPNQGK